MTPRRYMASLLVTGGAVLLPLLGCAGPASVAEPEAGASLIVVQSPVGSRAPGGDDAVEPASRFASGSRIVVVNGDPPRVHHVVSAGLAAAGAPALSPDGRRVLFTGRRTDGAAWAIYEASVDLGRPRPILEREEDCSDPAYLAGGRFVAACRDVGPDGSRRWSLYVARPRGVEPQRITFGIHDAFRPTALADGRILFSMRQGPGTGRGDATTIALFTVNPDGTLLDAFAGSHEPAQKFGARQVDDDMVVFLERTGLDTAPALRRIDFQRPHLGGTRLTLDAPVPPEAVGTARDADLLVALDGDAGDLAIHRMTPDGVAREVVFDEPGRHDIAAVAIRPRKPPRGRPSPVDPAVASGSLVCYDSSRGDGVVGPIGPSPARAMLRTVASDGVERGLGDLPVASDGSFFVDVPADVPLRVVTLDAGGGAIAASDWFWVRPGERRACFGCHEARDAAPVNRAIAALAREAVRLLPTDEVTP